MDDPKPEYEPPHPFLPVLVILFAPAWIAAIAGAAYFVALVAGGVIHSRECMEWSARHAKDRAP